MNISNNTKAQLLALTAVFIWSTIASAFKLSLQYLQVSELVFYAALTSLLFLFLFLLINNKLPLLFNISRQQYGRLLLLGMLNPLIYYLVLLHAYDQLPAQMAQSINYIWGIVLSFLSVPLLGYKLSKSDIFALLAGLFGVVVIATHGDFSSLNFENPFGIALALASAVLLALYWIFATRQKLEPAIVLFVAFLFATPLTFVVMLLDVGLTLPNKNGLFGAMYIGLFEMGLTFLLWLQALKLTDNVSKVASLIYLSPLVSFIFINKVVGETIYLSTLIGFAIIIVGLAVQQYFAPKTNA